MKTYKALEFFVILIIMLVVTLTLFTPIAANNRLLIRITLIAVFLVSWILLNKSNLITFRDLALTLLILNIAFLVVSFFTDEFWNLQMETSKGFALSKLSESLIISAVVILSFVATGNKVNSIYLTKGRLILGISIGVLLFIVFGYLAINNPQYMMEPEFIKENYIWILIFAFANGFMEELIYRGIFLKKLNKIMSPFWAIILTSICFAAPHLTANYTEDIFFFFSIVFVLGLITGFAMHYTRSIIAPTLIHAGADLMLILPVFASYGVVN